MNGGLTLIFFFAFVSGVLSTNFTIENKCEYTIWPGIYSSSSSSISITGFDLKKGQTRVIQAPISWAGRVWGRTLCSTDSTGNFTCATGDCGSGKIECAGATAKPPTTLAEFSLDAIGGQDFYDVTVVDGYNLPMVVTDEELKCQSPGCVVDLNKTCPLELMVNGSMMQPIACDSACKRFRSPVFCCEGEYASPDKCQPTLYSRNFKSACPRAYSYIYDDGTSTFTCSSSSNYVITFCPFSPPNTTARNNNGSSVSESPLAAPTNNETLEAPSQSQPPTESTATAGVKKKSSWKLKLVLGISSGVSLMIIIAILVIVIRSRARKSDQNDDNIEAVVMLKRYSYSKVKKMTNSFANVLGRGGFGIVYKGKLPGDGRDVAVKILKDLQGNGEEFMNEVGSMSRTSHVNIVSLLGFCYEGNKRAIIYEFIPNGSLDKFISEKMATKMDWKTLYNIAVGVSHGLEYLHNQCVSRIVHFDIKPQNILMDKDFIPKISDFGLAKLCKNKESIMSSLVDVRGTVGYMAPEVFSKNFGGVSHKSDVYSYGMVVLEMIGARNIENIGSNNSSSMYFPDWIYRDLEMGGNMRFLGAKIREEEEEKIAKKLVLVGLWCIQTNPSDRPSMIKVVEMLEGSLEDLEVPPKPLLGLPARIVSETVEESLESSNISAPR